MMSKQIQALILDIFEKIRIDKDADFDPQDFMPYLVPNPDHWGKTFQAQRQKITFLRRIETEFHICFPVEVYERNWSIDNLSTYVEERMKQNKANLQMAQKQITSTQQHSTFPLIIINLVIIGFWKLVLNFFDFEHASLIWAILSGICCFALWSAYAYFHRKEHDYYQKLYEMIQAQSQ